jgi:hypothetical protein
MSELWHFTCADGHAGIQRSGMVYPMATLTTKPVGGLGHFAWFTDLAEPDREALGLTSVTLSCDRTTHRYRVLSTFGVFWWPLGGNPEWTALLTGDPSHWWASRTGVPVEYAPLHAEAAT